METERMEKKNEEIKKPNRKLQGSKETHKHSH